MSSPPPIPEPTERKRWLKRFAHVAAWAAAEIAVGTVGLDQIAAYAEYLSDNQMVACITETISNLITMV